MTVICVLECCPLHRFKGICEQSMKALDTDVNRREELAGDRSRLKQELGSALKRGLAKR